MNHGYVSRKNDMLGKCVDVDSGVRTDTLSPSLHIIY